MKLQNLFAVKNYVIAMKWYWKLLLTSSYLWREVKENKVCGSSLGSVFFSDSLEMLL